MIREIRMSKKMTQDELAKKINVSRTTVSMWETGAANPTADKYPKIAEALNCTIDDLFREHSE